MRSLIKTVFGALLGFAIGLSFCFMAGESPLKIIQVLYKSSFGTLYDFGMTLFYTAPLILTGLAVSIPFKAGLFNIGAEGQLTMGALAAAGAGIVGEKLGIHSPVLAVFLAIAMGFAAGGLWGLIPGILKYKRGSHEVITTIMLNFIAAGVSSYFVLYLMKDPESSNPETLLLPEIYHLKPFTFLDGAAVGPTIYALILLVVFIHFWLRHSVWGYELKAVGENEKASELYGISKAKMWMTSFFLAGGIAGCVGVTEVLGNSHRFKVGFSADYGFVGIAVALVARGNILGILPAALLFGILQKGSGSLDLETEKVTREISYIIQGLIILGVTSEGLWGFIDRAMIKMKRNRIAKEGGKHART